MQIYGSKKGQGKQRQPVIAPDSAQSKTYINMLFGLGEGEIAGLANGYKSVYLDDTPLQNDNGEFNFPNVKVDFRNGTTDQTYIDGFPDVSSETAVNVELKHGTPYIKAFNNLDLDALRVRRRLGQNQTTPTLPKFKCRQTVAPTSQHLAHLLIRPTSTKSQACRVD